MKYPGDVEETFKKFSKDNVWVIDGQGIARGPWKHPGALIRVLVGAFSNFFLRSNQSSSLMPSKDCLHQNSMTSPSERHSMKEERPLKVSSFFTRSFIAIFSVSLFLKWYILWIVYTLDNKLQYILDQRKGSGVVAIHMDMAINGMKQTI